MTYVVLSGAEFKKLRRIPIKRDAIEYSKSKVKETGEAYVLQIRNVVSIPKEPPLEVSEWVQDASELDK